MLSLCTERRKADWHSSEFSCHFVWCCADFRNAECYHAEFGCADYQYTQHHYAVRYFVAVFTLVPTL